MRTADYHYELPETLIAQHPATERDGSRLLVLDRASRAVSHRAFRDLTAFLRTGDLLVFNNSRVIPARLRGRKQGTGGEVEVLLVEEVQSNEWWALLRPGKRVRAGTVISFSRPDGLPTQLQAVVQEKNDLGHCRLSFQGAGNILDHLRELGEIPLPPYIARSQPDEADRDRYQTVFADPPGSVAAPTAGLHFSPRLITNLKHQGVHIRFVTLHVGLATFAPVKTPDLEDHVMHEERYEIPSDTAQAIADARREGRRIVAVGTTTVRVLETAAQDSSFPSASSGRTRIFIRPPFPFRVVNALVTNFHLPESTLLMLVSAFAAPDSTEGRDVILRTYAEAIRQRYRFFSYGDAMLIQ